MGCDESRREMSIGDNDVLRSLIVPHKYSSAWPACDGRWVNYIFFMCNLVTVAYFLSFKRRKSSKVLDPSASVVSYYIINIKQLREVRLRLQTPLRIIATQFRYYLPVTTLPP